MYPRKKRTVSVLLITYNHEKFIAQAIESVLMQQADFYYELVIGEDCSTDRTREIVSDYKRKHPDRIRLLLSENNLGMIHNFVKTLQNCKGQYIALFEGDDYWTDPLKLQKQVNFLESHPDCSICFHNVSISNEDGLNRPWNNRLAEKKTIFTLEDLLHGNFIHTCSVMFRRGLFNHFPQWFYQCEVGDWPLHILNAQHGDIGYINQVMAAYRIHSTGVWSSKNQIEMKIDSICAANKILRILNHKHKKKLNYTLTQWYKQIMQDIKFLAEKRNFDDASYYSRKCFSKFLNLDIISNRMLTELFFIGHFPRLTYLVIRKSYRKILSIIC